MSYFGYPFSPFEVGWEHENEIREDRIWNVQCPGVYTMQAQTYKSRDAVLIVPGGAYFKLNPIHNGFNYGKWLNSMGIDAYILIHTLPHQKGLSYPYHIPFDQATKAISVLSRRGYQRVGIWGTSAGGHVAAMVHADFKILFSPVITMDGLYVHENSKRNLLGTEPSQGLIDYYSAENGIGSKYANTFILHCQDDKKVSIMNSLMYYESVISDGHEVDMHLPSKGDHEICLNCNYWQPILKQWIEKI